MHRDALETCPPLYTGFLPLSSGGGIRNTFLQELPLPRLEDSWTPKCLKTISGPICQAPGSSRESVCLQPLSSEHCLGVFLQAACQAALGQSCGRGSS